MPADKSEVGAADLPTYLDDLLLDLDTFPTDLQFLLSDLRDKDKELCEVARSIVQKQRTLHKCARPNAPASQQVRVIDAIGALYVRADALAREKVEIASNLMETAYFSMVRLDEDLDPAQIGWNDVAVEAKEKAAVPVLEPEDLDYHEVFDDGAAAIDLDEKRPDTRKRTRDDTDPNAPRKQRLRTRGHSDDPGSVSALDEDDTIYCVCRQPSYGEMVACDNRACQFQWFHYKCVGLEDPPPSSWFCKACKDAS